MAALAHSARPMTQRSYAAARRLASRRAPLLPALIFTIIVTQMPFLLTIVISTLNWNILQPGEKSFLGWATTSRSPASTTTRPCSPTRGCGTLWSTPSC